VTQQTMIRITEAGNIKIIDTLLGLEI